MRGRSGANIDRDKFEEAVLCEDRDNNFVACFRVMIKKR
jgi:hypothetical protein